MQANFDDIEAGLSERITKTGKTTYTANQPMGGFKLTTLGAGSARGDSANLAQVQDGAGQYAASSGTDTITATLSPAIAVYAVGTSYRLKKDTNANTGAVTLNLNSLGAGAVTWPDGTALAAGDLPANSTFEVVVQAATPVFHLQTSPAPAVKASVLTTRGDIMRRDATGPARIAIGAADTVLGSDGTDPVYVTRIGAVRTQTFTSSGTYTPHAKMIYCEIECIGGGGGGGGVDGDTNAMAASGGGSGGYSRKLCTASDIGASKVVTIGAAGTAGSAGNNNGGDGGDTSVGTLCVAKGGGGGQGMGPIPDTAQGGAGGSTSGAAGDFTAAGNPGASGMYIILASGLAWSGNGGASHFGGAGRGVMVDGATTAGGAAQNYGSGGAGAASRNNSGTAAGGAGAAGLVSIKEYCIA